MSRFSKTKTIPILPRCQSSGSREAKNVIPGVESSKVVGHQRKTEAGTVGVS